MSSVGFIIVGECQSQIEFVFLIKNFISLLCLTAVKLCIPKLIHVIPSQGRGCVAAVASDGDDVYVLRDNSQEVEVYDAETFALKCHIKVHELGHSACGLAVCPNNSCLYASGYSSDNVHRVDLKAGNAVKMWPVSGHPRGLSVNKAHNLVVACDGASKLPEYTTHGSLVREICLHPEAISPWHAVQLSSGDYVVRHGEVSVVGVDGKVVQRYGQSVRSQVGQMTFPGSLAVTKNDEILVADEGNNRIVSIKTSTGCIRVEEMILPVVRGMRGPRGLCLDESRGRLYVGEFDGKHRVLVFGRVIL